MPEDGQLFPLQIVRTDGNDTVHLVRPPFLPGAAVKPDLEVQTRFPDFLYGAKDCVGAYAVRAVRIGKIAGHIDLRRLEPLVKREASWSKTAILPLVI